MNMDLNQRVVILMVLFKSNKMKNFILLLEPESYILFFPPQLCYAQKVCGYMW